MKGIYQKELKAYFYTMTGWLFLTVYLALASLMFYLNNILPRSSDFAPFLSMMSYIWMLLTPLLVMRLMAAEKRQNTDSLLRSAPISVSAVLLGKYLAACTVLALAVLLSLAYPLMMSAYARVFPAEVLAGYTGFFLQGCAFIALDLMVTATAKHTASAAALAFGINLFVWMTSLLPSSVLLPDIIARVIQFSSLYNRFVPFLNAQFSLANTLFYVLFSLSMLALAVMLVRFERARVR